MGKKIALSLSGGGARGFFHLGVLVGLNDLGVKVDRLLGTSAGALVASFYSSGMPPMEIAETFFNFAFLKHLRLSLNVKGLISTKPIFKAISPYFPENDFSSLKIPVTISCIDFRGGSVRYFSEGELLKPLVASFAIPVIFDPVEIDGKLYVDGGSLDNMPIQGIKKEEYFLIGSNSNPIGEFDGKLNFLSSTERAFFLAVSGNVESSKGKCDLVLENPGMGKYRASDLKKGKEMIRLGIEEVKRKEKELLQMK